MSYGPCDFQDYVIEVARSLRISGLPRGDAWGSDAHEQAAWRVGYALENGAQAIKDRKQLVRALSRTLKSLSQAVADDASAYREHRATVMHAQRVLHEMTEERR